MFAGVYPGDGRWRKVSRGVGDAAPYGLPGNGRQREPAPHPALRGHLPPRGKARVVIPPGVLAVTEGRGGVGAPRPTDGDMETLWGLRGQPFPGRRAVGAGHCGVVSVGPRLSGAKPGSEQCLPPRGKQPHERASFAGWRRSLCAAKRPPRGSARPPFNGQLPLMLQTGHARPLPRGCHRLPGGVKTPPYGLSFTGAL